MLYERTEACCWRHLIENDSFIQILVTHHDNSQLSSGKCKFSNSLKSLQYLVVGYKPGQKKYVDLSYILPLISYSIFKAYCLSENRKKYLDAVYLAKTEFQKAKQVSKSLKLSQSRLFNNLFKYFVRRKIWLNPLSDLETNKAYRRGHRCRAALIIPNIGLLFRFRDKTNVL